MRKLYLIPMPLGRESDIKLVLPVGIAAIIERLDGVIAEDGRRARAQLEMTARALDSSFRGLKTDFRVRVLNEHSSANEAELLINEIKSDESWGLISDAGMPVIADPGSDLIRGAHKAKIRVIPLIGPSSIILALAASGMCGQHFTFHGYLERNEKGRAQQLRQMEKSYGTQVFIETPYRNEALLQTAIAVLRPDTQLAVAVDLTLETEEIQSCKIGEWRKRAFPNIKKRPAVFVLDGNDK